MRPRPSAVHCETEIIPTFVHQKQEATLQD